MTDATPEVAGRRRRPRWQWIVVGIGAALGIAFVVTLSQIPTPTESFDAEIAQLRAAGYATSYEGLAGPAPAPDDDGMPLFIAAMDEVPTLVGEPSTWTIPGPWREDCEPGWELTATPEEMADVRAFLARLEPVFRKLDAAAARPRLATRPVAGPDGFPRESSISNLQRVHQLLTGRAVASASPEERLAAAVTAMRIARRTDAYSTIGEMVRIAVVLRAVNTLRPQVESGRLSASAARAAVDPELRFDVLPRFGVMARFELVQTAEMYTRLLHGQDLVADDGTRIESRKVAAPGMAKVNWLLGGPTDALRSLRAMAEVPAGSLTETRRGVDAVVADTKYLNRHVTIVFPLMVARCGKAQAVLRLARVALAVAERHETAGAWPASLDDVRGEFADGLPLDPYTDAPFDYVVGDATVRIASAATPEKYERDDGQSSDAWLRENGLVWEFPR